MEFFEALTTFVIQNRDGTLEEVTGTKLNNKYFAFQSDVKSFGWSITDTASGLQIKAKLPTLKACKDYLKDMPEEEKEKINKIRSTEKYKAQCEKVAAFKPAKTETFDMSEALAILNTLYEGVVDIESLFDFGSCQTMIKD